MLSTHLSLHDHFVFGTKNREPWLPPTARKRVHKYIGGIVRNMNGIAHAVGGTGDHVHIAAGLRATHCLGGNTPRLEWRIGWPYSRISIAFAARWALARASLMFSARARVTAMRRWPLTLGLPKSRTWVSGSART